MKKKARLIFIALVIFCITLPLEGAYENTNESQKMAKINTNKVAYTTTKNNRNPIIIYCGNVTITWVNLYSNVVVEPNNIEKEVIVSGEWTVMIFLLNITLKVTSRILGRGCICHLVIYDEQHNPIASDSEIEFSTAPETYEILAASSFVKTPKNMTLSLTPFIWGKASPFGDFAQETGHIILHIIRE